MIFLALTLLGLIAGAFALFSLGYFISLKASWIPKVAEEQKAASDPFIVSLAADAVAKSLKTSTGVFSFEVMGEVSSELRKASAELSRLRREASSDHTNIFQLEIKEQQPKEALKKQKQREAYA
jgi:hypothetical protein